MSEPGPIVNCHTHVFTTCHVPRKFLPFGLPVALRFAPLRGILEFVTDNLWPFSNKDQLSRLASFVRYTYGQSQTEIFKQLVRFYPERTRFVVLSMDMRDMGAGRVDKDLPEQLDELAELKAEYGDRIVPFVAVDPRREGILDLVKKYIEDHRFGGIKLYPPLGYWPNDERLMPIYEYAAHNRIPVLTHTARGGVYYRGTLTEEMLTDPGTGKRLKREPNRRFTDRFADPENYRFVLREHPSLKLCLAHFGSTVDWEGYLKDPWSPDGKHEEDNWIHTIRDLIREYEHVYTDVSYTLVDERIIPLLKMFLHEPRVRDRVLFGTDFYMMEKDGTEREVAIRFRYQIGEAYFRALAIENPHRFLSLG